MNITYRTHSDFARLAMINVVQECTYLILVPLIWVGKFYGLCFQYLGMIAINFALLWHWRPIKVRPTWDFLNLKHLLKIGGPIFLVGRLYSVWILFDATFILALMGPRSLGLYQLAVISGTTLGLVPGAMSQVIYPRMAERFGRSGKLEDILSLAWRPMIILGMAMIPITIVAFLILPDLVPKVLPAYVDGTRAAQWSLVVACLTCFNPVANAFNVVKRQGFYAVAIILGMSTYLAMLFLPGRAPLDLESFPQAMVAGQIVFIACCYVFLWNFSRREKASSYKQRVSRDQGF